MYGRLGLFSHPLQLLSFRTTALLVQELTSTDESVLSEASFTKWEGQYEINDPVRFILGHSWLCWARKDRGRSHGFKRFRWTFTKLYHPAIEEVEHVWGREWWCGTCFSPRPNFSDTNSEICSLYKNVHKMGINPSIVRLLMRAFSRFFITKHIFLHSFLHVLNKEGVRNGRLGRKFILIQPGDVEIVLWRLGSGAGV